MNLNLSYILVTRNKKPYLEKAITDALKHLEPDEELIVVDGASTDGSKEYLEKLYKAGKISQFISEPDHGEAHADNKALLMAKGKLAKIITDDDAVHFPGFRAMKHFMLEHTEIDGIFSDGIKRRQHAKYPFSPMVHRPRFDIWKRRHTPFAFCGLGLMLRVRSIPLLGLLDTSYARVDAEYTMRITAGKARLALYTLECYSHIRNNASNSVTQESRMLREMEKLETIYLDKPKNSRLYQWTRNSYHNILSKVQKPTTKEENADLEFSEWSELYDSSLGWLQKNAANNTGEFIY